MFHFISAQSITITRLKIVYHICFINRSIRQTGRLGAMVRGIREMSISNNLTTVQKEVMGKYCKFVAKSNPIKLKIFLKASLQYAESYLTL